MPNASLALNQGGNVSERRALGAGLRRLPLEQVLFYHEKRLTTLENKDPTKNTVNQIMESQATTAIELLSQRLGKVEALLQQLQQQQEQQNTIQLEVEEADEDEEQEEETE